MPASGPRKYQLIQDLNGTTVFGPEDGSVYYGLKSYNVATIAAANLDGSSGQIADLGVKDNDLSTIMGIANWYVANLNAASANADNKITFPGTVHEVIIDNTRSANAVFVELNDTTAGTGSIQIVQGALAVLGCNSTIMHFWTSSAPASNLVIRGQ